MKVGWGSRRIVIRVVASGDCSELQLSLPSSVGRITFLKNKDKHMRHIVVPTLAILFAAAGSMATAADLVSGLQVGDRAGAFNVNDCTGPRAGDSLCYR